MEEPGVAAPGWEFCGVVRGVESLVNRFSGLGCCGPKAAAGGQALGAQSTLLKGSISQRSGYLIGPPQRKHQAD